MTIYVGSVIGDLPSSDVFQFGIHMDDSGALSLSLVDTALRAAVGILFNGNGGTLVGLKAQYVPTTVVQTVRTASLSATTGKQVDALQAALSIPGTHAATATLPQEVCIGVTTRGASTNRRSRGRFYMPATATDTATTAGRLASATQTLFVNHVQGFLQRLVTGGVTPVIYHRDLLTATPITRIDVGDVFDAQRRRRDKLVEVRVAATI
jgi:hypothetical protein